ncbi:MAG: transcriptional repressor [Eubacteriales bacterium]|nr:transcriptional repressor [Eubacteriales bacterium]
MAKYMTGQRKQMQDLFVKHPHEMFSAKEIEELIGNESVSISAVYRNLSELEDSGLVRRCSKNGSREAFYQYTGTEACKGHIHLTCKKCGKTFHMELEDTNALIHSALKYRDFSVDIAETVLFGTCGACKNI